MQHPPLFSPLTRKLLHTGLGILLTLLVGLFCRVCASAYFSAATAERFGYILRHIVASLAILTVGSYLLEKAQRSVQ